MYIPFPYSDLIIAVHVTLILGDAVYMEHLSLGIYGVESTFKFIKFYHTHSEKLIIFVT